MLSELSVTGPEETAAQIWRPDKQF